ncbi:MAG: hypothetical protein R3305_07500 [Gammaproteobacteria bacterium]|nr:hypothetical protein [Gammaproteobacteria bacterium]
MDDNARAEWELGTSLIRPEPDNFVERPWGGHWIRRFKSGASSAWDDGLGPDAAGDAEVPRWGEAFEISAYDADDEASRFPSRVRLADGTVTPLPALLEAHSGALLGEAFVGRYGACFPLLPKTLDVKELLSVQGHPPGNTEVYIIIDAEPGATLRLGFNRDIEPASTIAALTDGLAHARIVELMIGLKALYWQMLDSMNAIAVEPGQVIYNATPERLTAVTGKPASAEVHALGNPEGKEILALEIRRPGPTFRAWDNVRFPQRQVDVAAAIGALNLQATSPDDFIRQRVPVPGRDGASVSVDCEYFRVEHWAPRPGRSVVVESSSPHSLHCLAGNVAVIDDAGRIAGRLARGESAIVPVGLRSYRVEAVGDADAGEADVVQVTLPEN